MIKLENKIFQKIDYLVIVLLLVLVILLTVGFVLIPITGSYSYYAMQYEKHDTLKWIAYSYYDLQNNYQRMVYTADELETITRAIIDYLLFGKESMQVEVIRDGVAYDVFSIQALTHMADVKVVYQKGIVIGVICIFLLALCIFYFVLRKNYILNKWFITSILTGGALFLIILAVGIYVLADFDKAFYIFHKVLFPGDKFDDAYFSTISNYQSQEKYYINNLTLTNILNEDIFMDAGIICVAVLLVVLLAYFITTYFVSRKANKKLQEKFNLK